ncbi:hypothetical protein [uncultured Bradyrhizobium sp.]|jgi:hypothetical protein|uniref:hypothetical protein n=1 Tax=uncultured Bradyrhizobium sp. TaxID=199684 RepID=UPI00261747BE|nr:hypothetical protein [uncultured Bradyrhizobium sp.]
MEIRAMVGATQENEIRLAKSLSRQDRLLLAGFAATILCFGIMGLINWSESVVAAPIALILGILMLCHAGFGADVLWIIGRNGVLIEKASPLGRRSSRFIRSEDISAADIDTDRTDSTRFHLSLRLASGDHLTSPTLSDITHVRQTSARIAEQLGFPTLAPPVNPFDATNAEIHLGETVTPIAGYDIRIVTLIIAAGLCAAPYAYKFWNGLPLTPLEIVLIPVGIIAALLFYRYAYSGGTSFWIIRRGELCVERRARDGRPHVDTITGRHVDTIGIERDSNTEEDRYVVRIDLLDRRKFLSPGIGTREETFALVAEIAFRLGIAPQRVRR